MYEWLASIEDGPLREVIVVGTGQEVRGVYIELLAFEVRLNGGYGRLRVEDRRANRKPFGPDAFDLSDPALSLSDTSGQIHRVFATGIDGATDSVWRVTFAFRPAFATPARVRFAVESFADPSDGRVVLPGPWEWVVTAEA